MTLDGLFKFEMCLKPFMLTISKIAFVLMITVVPMHVHAPKGLHHTNTVFDHLSPSELP